MNLLTIERVGTSTGLGHSGFKLGSNMIKVVFYTEEKTIMVMSV